MQYARGDLRHVELWALPRPRKPVKAKRRIAPKQTLKFEPLLPVGDRPLAIAANERAKPTRARRVRNWFIAWFRKETRTLVLLNAALSVAALIFALPLAPFGFAHFSSPVLRAEAGLQSFTVAAYAGLALIVIAALMASHAHIFRRHHIFRKAFATLLALVLVAGGLWLLAVWYYAERMPDLLKPDTAMAADRLVAELDYYNAFVVPLILPALAVTAGVLLSLKQIKSTIAAWRGHRKKLLALAGLATSLSTLAIGAYAGEARVFGFDFGFVMPADGEMARTEAGFSPPFASGVPCHVSDNFGERRNPFDPSHYEFHPGVDIGVAEGTPVQAMASGRVLFAGVSGGYGNMVAIDVRDGMRRTTILSGHLQSLFVQQGDTVSGGDVIGQAGSTGRSTGPHLHLQVCSDARVTRFGAFVCGTAENPYEVWHTLSAIARASCAHGPVVSSTDLVSMNARPSWTPGITAASLPW